MLLSRGTAGGDESLPVQDAAELWSGNFAALFQDTQAPWLAHRFFWFLEKALWQGMLQILVPPALRRSSLAHDAWMVADSVLFMFAAVIVMLRHLKRRGYDWPLASLTAGSFFFASSAISFFSGGVLECQMIFYAVVVAAILDSPDARKPVHFAILLAASACLIFCKTYALAALLPLALLLPRPREKMLYLVLTGFLFAVWALILRLVGGSGGVVSVYSYLLGYPTLGATVMHFGEFFVAFPFGIVWCFPLVCVTLFANRGAGQALMLKLAGILVLAAILSLFSFWHGGGAVAGPRYVPPFLMLLFPEVAAGLKSFLRRWRWIGMAVPLLTLLFLPALDYHNGLVYRWANRESDYSQWGEADPLMQPGVLAWRVVMAKSSLAENFRPSARMAIAPRTQDIFPMTGLSRLTYLMSIRNPPPQQASERDWLKNHGLDHALLWNLLRGLLMGALLIWMSLAALKAAREPAR